MIVNLYIEINREVAISEFERLSKLEKLLITNGFAFYNATDFDSCCSGPNKCESLEEIECAVEGK